MRIWIQAVSVGEVVASAPILKELKAIAPDAELIVSTTTVTGHSMAKKTLPEADYIVYYPFDMPMFARRALRRIRPDVFVSVESEIWPNFLAAAKAMGVRTLIVNGIISDRTFRRAMRLRPVYAWALSNVDKMLMQTEADAERIIALGADSARVEVVGNCKFDQEKAGMSADEAAEMRGQFGFANGRKVFIAGSTNPGEDEPVLDALMIARKSCPDLRLVIAPRQLERTESIIEMCSSRGLTCGRRSLPDSITGCEDVIVLDTFGELASVYGIGDVAFVGGSFIRKGGHNILQPIMCGKPVMFGPHTFKARSLVDQARNAGVGFEVSDGAALGAKISELLSNQGMLDAIREKALGMIAANRGAARRCAEAIAGLSGKA